MRGWGVGMVSEGVRGEEGSWRVSEGVGDGRDGGGSVRGGKWGRMVEGQ